MARMKDTLISAATLLDIDPNDLQTAADLVEVRYEIHADDSHSRGTVKLPSWCSGDPKMAVALYFFGERTSVGFVTKADIL